MTLAYEIWLQLDYQIPLTKAAVKFPTGTLWHCNRCANHRVSIVRDIDKPCVCLSWRLGYCDGIPRYGRRDRLPISA
jgi:hypothetical protein